METKALSKTFGINTSVSGVAFHTGGQYKYYTPLTLQGSGKIA
jgi:hypothetical protein